MNSNFLTSNFIKSTAFVLSILFLSFNANGQASTVVHSTDGYDVSISLDVVKVIAPSSCPWGYNYNTRISYDISFSGNNIPSKLYTMQASLECGSQGNFIGLPVKGGSGFKNTTSNPWNSNSDCQTATPESLNCNAFVVQIEGPGISSQTIRLTRIIALPVKLISFDAIDKNMNVQLNWKTSSEENSSHFIVERSIDGNNWLNIGRVDAFKNASTIQSYSFTDKNSVDGLSFYRLIQVDLDGKSTIIDNIVPVNHTPSVQISVYPNPASTHFSVEAGEISEIEITIYDAMGKTISINGLVDGNRITFNTESLLNGIYFVQVAQNEEVKSFKLTVNK
ncbi:MAG: T9SS type A sorting domain-containing protein [Bacteroidia bacterium]